VLVWCLVAVVSLHGVGAFLAVDLTTPDKLAVTVVRLLTDERLIATPTTHQHAPVHTLASFVTFTTFGSK